MVVRTLLPSYALPYCVCLLCLIPFICEAVLDSSHLPLDLLDSDDDDGNGNSSSSDESVLLDEHDGVAWTGAGTPMPELVAPLKPAVAIAAGTLEPAVAITAGGTLEPAVAIAAGGTPEPAVAITAGTPEPGTVTARILEAGTPGTVTAKRGTGGRA